MLLELPGLLGLAGFSMAIRHSLRLLESDSRVVGGDDHYGIEPDTGVYEERFLRPAIEAELSRSRRFDREFALIVVGIDELHLRFDYRSDEEWRAGFLATAQLLRRTRNNIDRVYRYGPAGFALVLPESGPQEATGLVRRLRRLARSSRPREGDPGGPLPVSFGATFFPTCATTVDDLLRRADIAQRLAEKNTDHLQLDSAAAPAGPAPETLRREPETEEDTTLAAEPVVTVGPLTNGAAGSNGHQVEDDMVELLKRFDETRALLHRLRTGEPVEKAS
jgi:diguanylate cyclase (GGDEF)-like protein